MFNAIKSTYGKLQERFNRMQEHKRAKRQQSILDDMSMKLFELRTASLDNFDLDELEQAQDIVHTLYEENCK